MRRPSLAGALAMGAACLVLVAWGVAFAPWPDDWDGLGFLASIERFDLAAFSPHPPGYPVYVALLELAAIAFPPPIEAARAVALFAGLVTIGCFARARRFEDRGSVLAVVLLFGTPLVFHAFSGVGSEAPALACAAVAGVGLSSSVMPRAPRARAVLVGLGVGLGLGVRLSWAPFFVPFLILLPARLRVRALVVTTFACLAWAVPLAARTGPSQLVLLARTHVAGHLTLWGGTALTEPARARFLLRDLVVDGFGGGADALGIAVVIGLVAALAASAHGWIARTSRAERPAQVARAALLVVPYLAWITFGQNLRQQPRHALPLVALLAYALARAAVAPRPHPARTALLALLATLLVTRTAIDAHARRTVPPPGAQLLAYLRGHASSAPPATTAVFAGASVRFLDGTEWQAHAHAAGSLGDALLALTRLDRLPSTLLVTSELVDLDGAPAPLAEVATLCRPERLDRRLPCMQVYALDVRAATSP